MSAKHILAAAMLTTLFAILLAAAACAILFYLAGLLLKAANLPLDGVFDRWRVSRGVARSRQGDALREQGAIGAALQEYHAAFCLFPIRDRHLASTVANHHTGLLSRLIAITEDVQGGTVRLLSLAKVDRLLNDRSEMQRRYGNAGREGGRAARSQVDGQLRDNARDLAAALGQLLTEIQGSRPAERMH